MSTFQCSKKIKIHENLVKSFNKTKKAIDLFDEKGQRLVVNFIPEFNMDCWVMKLTDKINLVTYEDPAKYKAMVYIDRENSSTDDLTNKSIEDALLFHSIHAGVLIIFKDN